MSTGGGDGLTPESVPTDFPISLDCVTGQYVLTPRSAWTESRVSTFGPDLTPDEEAYYSALMDEPDTRPQPLPDPSKGVTAYYEGESHFAIEWNKRLVTATCLVQVDGAECGHKTYRKWKATMDRSKPRKAHHGCKAAAFAHENTHKPWHRPPTPPPVYEGTPF